MYGQLLGNPPGPDLGPPPGAPPLPPAMGAPPGAALGVNAGKPPMMPGLPPPPTGIGAIPTGDPSTNKKEAADNAVLALRELKGHFPALGSALDGIIDQIKSVAKVPAKPTPGFGEPVPPGSTGPEESALPLSGGPGGF